MLTGKCRRTLVRGGGGVGWGAVSTNTTKADSVVTIAVSSHLDFNIFTPC